MFIGNPNPDFTYGLNLVFGIKDFDLTAFFYGSQGNEIFNYNKWWLDFWPSFQGQKSTDLLYNSWTPTNTDATIPMASNKSNFSTNTVSNSYYVEDGSFFRLKNLQIRLHLRQGRSWQCVRQCESLPAGYQPLHHYRLQRTGSRTGQFR